ncbi:HalOD1 output domain-containing protein [Halobaculum gomorrense]|uniref:Halobacterial output domain-containing protein n=1 Tax=Halobaculum gomorrense TaxID=43928 RepID=A0A1M5QJY0_9EURY|nr:HalOD1 output domain-containing protein [Halobaculum gomorrense]SHH14397.1 hypothetical protein SAMN05443636_1939 [Halobaculum gomorrense]
MSDGETGDDERGDELSGWSLPPSALVVDRVAAAEGTEPVDLRARLYDVVDPEALDRIVERGAPELTVEFRFNGYRVTVDGDGTVLASDAARE